MQHTDTEAALNHITSLNARNHLETHESHILAVIAESKQHSQSPEDLTRSIAIYEQALTLLPNHSPLRFNILQSIGDVLQKRFDLTRSLDDLDRSIALYEGIMTSLSYDNPVFASYCNALSAALLRRFDCTGLIEDLDRAIITAEQAVELATNEDPDRVTCLGTLANALVGRFRNTGSMEYFERAIKTNEQAISLMPEEGHPRFWAILANLGATWLARFERTDSMDALERAIVINEQIVSLAPKDGPDYLLPLRNLGLSLKRRYDQTGSIDDLARAVTLNEQALELLSNVHPSRSVYLNNLGALLLSRFKHNGSEEDLDRAIKAHEQAVELTPPNDQIHRAMYLNDLANSFQIRFEVTASTNDLNHEIATYEKAMALIPNDHRSYKAILNRLSTALKTRFEQSGSMADLNRAVAIIEQTEALTENDETQREWYLNGLETALQGRYDRWGSVSDLNRLIEMKEQVVKVTPIDDPKFPTQLSSLSFALRSRFKRAGSINDLERAIEASEQAVTLCPNDTACLTNLGLVYFLRHERTESMEDLDHAIMASERSLAALRKDYDERAVILNNLGNMLQARFERRKSISDLNRAIALHEEAVASTPNDAINHAMYLSNLGIAFQKRFEETGSVEDLNTAIKTLKKSVTLAPNHPESGMYFNNLGNSLLSRFERTDSISDLDRVIETYERAVASGPDDSLYLRNLSDALQKRFEKTGSNDDLINAIAMNEKASVLPTATPYLQIRAAQSASKLLIGKDNNRAKTLLERAVQQLPAISPRTLSQSDKQYNISRFSDITSMAVSMYLECGEDPAKAVQLSEMGRGIIASLQLGVRSDLSALSVANPELAQQFTSLRDQLDRPRRNVESTENNFFSDTAHRHALSKQFSNLVDNIRQLKDFERFLLGPTESELKGLAQRNPIILLNVSEIRSDAIIIDKQRISSLRLSSLKYPDLRDKVFHFLQAIHTVTPKTYSSANREVIKVLEWLWDVAVGPILDELGFIWPPAHSDTWPRVWWVPSGLLTLLPIHAAGYHDSTRTAIDRVISSYASTLKSLAYALERGERTKSLESQKAMLLSMPKTPSKLDLPYAEREIHELHRLMAFSAKIQLTIIPEPTRAAVLSAIHDQQVVHLSCHGQPLVSDPSQSRLLLCDWETAPLTVSDFVSLNCPLPQLAYLSACHTANMVTFRLLDESINLSAAIQLAGYPSVVGTLWHVADDQSVDIAKDVYAWMLEGGAKLDTTRSAEGLHRAVRALKDKTRTVAGFSKKGSSDPLVWAPYIHLGV